MRVPFTDIRVEYMDSRERRVLDARPDGLREVPLLGWTRYTHARPDLPVHRHRETMEIVYMDSGTQVFQLAEQEFHVRGGDVFVVFPNEPHSTGGHPMAANAFYWLNLRMPPTGRGLLGFPTIESRLLVRRLLGLPHRQFRSGRPVKACFERLIHLHDHPEVPLRTIRMRQTVVDLLLHVVDSAARRRGFRRLPANGGGHSRHREPSAVELPIAGPCTRGRLSLSRFKVRFKAETGISPRKFIVRNKISAAQRRLAAGSDSVLDIALDLGFPSSQYFATVFKRIVGMTPHAYRQGVSAPLRASRRRSDGQV